MTSQQDVDLSAKVFQAIGAASVCWTGVQAGQGGLGEFDTTRAKQIGDELLGYINANYVKIRES